MPRACLLAGGRSRERRDADRPDVHPHAPRGDEKKLYGSMNSALFARMYSTSRASNAGPYCPK
jgi:hypothetical protein